MEKNIKTHLNLFSELVSRFNDSLSDNDKHHEKKNILEFKNYSGGMRFLRRFLEKLSSEEKDCFFFIIQVQHFLTKEVLKEVLEEPEEKIPSFETIEELFPNLTSEQLEKIQKWIEFLKIDLSHDIKIFGNFHNIYIPKPSAPTAPLPPPPPTPPPVQTQIISSVNNVPAGLRVAGWSNNPRPPNPNSYRHTPHVRISSTVPHQASRPAPVMRNNNDRVRSLAELKAILGER